MLCRKVIYGVAYCFTLYGNNYCVIILSKRNDLTARFSVAYNFLLFRYKHRNSVVSTISTKVVYGGEKSIIGVMSLKEKVTCEKIFVSTVIFHNIF